MNIFTGAAQTISFGYTMPDVCGLTCTGLTYQLTVTSGPNPSLITIPVSTTASMAFAPSSNLADVGTYYLSVTAQFA